MKETLVSLRKNREFKKVFRRGKKFFSRYMVVYYLKNGLNYNRYGFSISKKVGNSVVRHRVKRLFVEVIRRMQEELAGGYDFVIVAKKTSGYMDYHECKKDVLKAMNRESLMIKEKRRGKTWHE